MATALLLVVSITPYPTLKRIGAWSTVYKSGVAAEPEPEQAENSEAQPETSEDVSDQIGDVDSGEYS